MNMLFMEAQMKSYMDFFVLFIIQEGLERRFSLLIICMILVVVGGCDYNTNHDNDPPIDNSADKALSIYEMYPAKNNASLTMLKVNSIMNDVFYDPLD